MSGEVLPDNSSPNSSGGGHPLRTGFILGGLAIVLAIVSIGIGQLSYSWLPPQASSESLLVDNLFSFLVALGSFIFLGVTGTILYSVLFQRAGKYDMSDGPHIEGNVTLEVVWTTIPILLVFLIAGYSYQIYKEMGIQGPGHHMPAMMQSPETAIVAEEEIEKIEVIGKQWAWVFRYPNQDVTSTELHLPANRRVRLAMESEDVLHGFYIPAFRVKQDLVPGETIDLEFTPIRPGTYRLNDSQFSGAYFAIMEADVVVESPQEYQQWLTDAATRTPTQAPNSAVTEYAEERSDGFKVGWPTVAPAKAPVVNYHG